jgi:hypothetical protein
MYNVRASDIEEVRQQGFYLLRICEDEYKNSNFYMKFRSRFLKGRNCEARAKDKRIGSNPHTAARGTARLPALKSQAS